jgi:hypothetical protein
VYQARGTLFSMVGSGTEINCDPNILILNERTGRPMITYTLGESGSSAVHPSFYPDAVNKIPIETDANDLLTFL